MLKKCIFTCILTLLLTSPSINTRGAEVASPKITGEYAISIDANTMEVIYSKNGDSKAYPASLTKLLTASILLENKTLKDNLYYSKIAKYQPISSINRSYKLITVGEELSVDSVLKSMILVSANDMAEVVGTNIPNLKSETDDAFIKLMNDKAISIGMIESHFVTANGLDSQTLEHYSTAYDLSLLGKEAYKNKNIMEISKIPETEITIGNTSPIKLINTNKFVRPNDSFYDPSCIGGKTGYTDKAGRCLITMFERSGKKIIGVVLKSNRSSGDSIIFNDMKNLINFSYTSVKSPLIFKDPYTMKITSYESNKTISTVPLSYKLFGFFGPTKVKNVDIYLNEPINYYKNEFNNTHLQISYSITDSLFRSSNKNPIGKLDLSIKNNKSSYNIYSKTIIMDILKDNALIYFGLLFLFVVFLLFLRIIQVRTRRKRRRNLTGMLYK